VITGIPAESVDCVSFHAGTALKDAQLTTSGGRVLCVVGLGDSVKIAQKHAYDVVDQIWFEGAQFRRDIGWRALKRPA
jgi:phosphoribosylamine--glycine ligase